MGDGVWMAVPGVKCQSTVCEYVHVSVYDFRYQRVERVERVGTLNGSMNGRMNYGVFVLLLN